MGDREDVLDEIVRCVPEFELVEGLFQNHHALREIMLGGSPPWKGFHERFNKYEGTNVLDIGANEGVFAVYAALRGAYTLAYEPSWRIWDGLMDMMFRLIPIGKKLNPMPFAIWSKSVNLPFLSHFTQDPDALRSNGSLESEGIRWTHHERESAPRVNCVTLAHAIGDDEWDAVKMDIEGAEAEVILSTDHETFQKIKFMFIEFHPWVSDETYGKMLERLRMSFRIETAWTADTGRMESAYLWRK